MSPLVRGLVVLAAIAEIFFGSGRSIFADVALEAVAFAGFLAVFAFAGLAADLVAFFVFLAIKASLLRDKNFSI
jgi:hypothetical protein